MALNVDVLGPVQVFREGVEVDLGRAGQRALLGLLALARGQPLSRAELINSLWGDAPPPSAVNVLQTSVKHLRRSLEPDRRPRTPSSILPSVGDGYALRVPPEQVDLTRFRRLVAEAGEVHRSGDPRRAAGILGTALGIWRGIPLADITTLAGHPKIVALVQERHAALADYGEALIAAGAAVAALPVLETAVAEQPLDEAAHARLILGYRAAGRRAQAFTVYRAIRQRLADELGVDPGPELLAAHAALLTGGSGGFGAVATGVVTTGAVATGAVSTAAVSTAAVSTGFPEPVNGVPLAPRHPVPAQLPAYNVAFTGREEQLRRLSELLAEAESPGGGMLVIALSGTAGVGKTALAVQFAHRIRHLYPDGQLYVNLRGFDPHGTVMGQAEAIRAFLYAFGVPAERVPAGLDAQTALFRSVLADRRVLVVLDNARDAEQVRPLLPGSAGCLVLVTSRNQLTSLVAADGAHPVTLDLLSWPESRALLTRRLGAARTAAAPEAVDELINLCSRLPLALAIVAARAATYPDFPLTALAAQLREAGGSLDALADDDPATDVRAVFSWSYRALTPTATRLFRLLGLHPRPDVTVAAAASLAGVPVPEIRAPLHELIRAHLVTEHVPGRYTCHDLLHTYASELARTHDGEADRRAALHRVLGHWARTAYAADNLLNPHREQIPALPVDPGVTVPGLADRGQALTWLTAEHPVLLAAIELAATAGFDAHVWRLAWALTTFLDRRGHWHELAMTQRAALRAAQRMDDPHAQADAHRGLARAYIHLGHGSAMTHLRKALQLFRKLDDRSGQARIHLNMAWACERQGRHRTALGHAGQAVELFRAAGQRVGQADACNAVGWFHAHLAEHDRALKYCQEALRLHQETGDEDGEAHTWDSLGYIHDLLAERHEAIRCYRRAASLRRDLGDRYYEADTLHRIGDIHRAIGELDQARAAWYEALDIFDAFRHPDADTVRAKIDALPIPAGLP